MLLMPLLCLLLGTAAGVLGQAGLPIPGLDGIDEVVWTNAEEVTLLTEEEHKVAFRDVVLEAVAERMLNVILASSKVGSKRSRLPYQILIPDPVRIPDVAFSKAQPALFNIQFTATDLKIHGLHDSKIKHLHVLRHLGLNDIRIVVQFITPLRLDGQYTLTGTGLSLLPLQGNGSLALKIDDFMLTLETFLVIKDRKLYIRNLDVQMTEKLMDVNLENLMGDGLVGNVINDILTLVGEDLLYNNRQLLIDSVGVLVEQHVNNFLNF